MNHIIDKTCSCPYCLMIDCMFGDPLLSKWEKKFIDSVCHYGWYSNYTPKQKAVIIKTFNRQRKKYPKTG